MKPEIETVVILLLSGIFVGMSLYMTFAPDRFAKQLKDGPVSRRYILLTSSLKADEITAKRLYVRIQGIVGLFFSALLLFALYQRFAA